MTGIIGNPVYAINIAPALAKPHPVLISEQQWVATNAKLIADIGPEAYLHNLLSILKSTYPTAEPSQLTAPPA